MCLRARAVSPCPRRMNRARTKGEGMKSVRVDKARLQNRMEAISAFGATAGGGVTRLALSDADKDARQQLSAWLKELDCEIHVDGMGNIFAVLPGKDRSLPPDYDRLSR